MAFSWDTGVRSGVIGWGTHLGGRYAFEIKANPEVKPVNISDLTGTALNPYIAKALGHVGTCEINFFASGDIATQLYTEHGESLQRISDGFHCTMRYAGKFYTQHAKDPITAIYRAYIVSRLGDEF